MNPPNAVYDLLLDRAQTDEKITALCLGLVWTFCQAQKNGKSSVGLAMSPQIATRTLSFSGTLVGKSLAELAGWIQEWDVYKASIGMAAINCCINQHVLQNAVPLAAGNLAVFEHFLPQLQGKNVVVIGRYPRIETYREQFNLTILERQPEGADYPDPACEFLLPQADWVFLSGTTLVNKTFPRLAQLSQHATTVLMGPTVPWLPELAEFGIDYLAGVGIMNETALTQTVMEGGGMRIFEQAVRYYVARLQ